MFKSESIYLMKFIFLKLIKVNKNRGDGFRGSPKTKEVAEYLGIEEHVLRTLTKREKIKQFTSGNRFLYEKQALD